MGSAPNKRRRLAAAKLEAVDEFPENRCLSDLGVTEIRPYDGKLSDFLSLTLTRKKSSFSSGSKPIIRLVIDVKSFLIITRIPSRNCVSILPA